MKWEDFSRWFNNSFWRAFKKQNLPIYIPGTEEEKCAVVRRVYDAVISARYSPQTPEMEIVMDKGYGVARTVPVFCIEDYIVYYFCIKELEDVLCGDRTRNTFGGWTLGGLLRSQESMEIAAEANEYGRYSFNPDAWKQAFGEFNALLFAQIESGEYPFILEFDLSNFYDSIRLDILQRWICESAPAEKGWISALLFYFLNHWNRRNTGLHPQTVGIPQDALADCSRILANYYLQRYDKFAAALCTRYQAVYFRYSDDQMILLKSKDSIEQLMLPLTRKLDRYGLRVNQRKVRVWSAEELQEYRCRSIQTLFAPKGGNQNPDLVRRFVEAYLAIPAPELKNRWNGGRPLLNRLLWANLESLPTDLFEQLLFRFLESEYLSKATNRDMMRIYELNERRAGKLDFIAKIDELSSKSVHNGFHFEALSFAKDLNNGDLVERLQTRLREIEGLMSEDS